MAKNQKSTPPAAPTSFITLATDAIATLIPLYATTFRPFGTQLRATVTPYLAPTFSSSSAQSTLPIPASLRHASRRLVILLHHTAPKAGGAEDWAALTRNLLRDAHLTADQVFRPVEEAWRSSYGHIRTRIDFDKTAQGGGDAAEDLPIWTGTAAGATRLVGVIDFLATTLRQPTKTAVVIPLGALIDLVARISAIARQGPRSQSWDKALPLNPAASREERDELWSAMPSIHASAMGLIDVLIQRLRSNIAPVTEDLVEAMVRMFRSEMHVREVRVKTYTVLQSLLEVCGPGLTKPTVTSIDIVMTACCRDLLQVAGFPITPPSNPTTDQTTATSSTTKQQQKQLLQHSALSNADVFLTNQSSSSATASTIHPPFTTVHTTAASALLTGILTHVGATTVRPATRALLDRTAILSRDRAALTASVLAPYRTDSGRMYATMMPYLAGLFPVSKEMEVLRSTLRADGGDLARWDAVEDDEDDGDDEDDAEVDEAEENETDEDFGGQDEITIDSKPNPFTLPRDPVPPTSSFSALKRPSETPDARPAKRHEPLVITHVTSTQPQPVADAAILAVHATQPQDQDDSDADSVHLNMEFDEDNSSE